MSIEAGTEPSPSAKPTGAAPPEPLEPSAARYALGLLVVVYVFNFIDRSILSILLQPIKEEFQVSDTALGFLSGIAFAAFYSVLGIPVARWADRHNRTRLIALAVLIWSAMTAFSGLARSFVQLAVARIGVGIGEAGCSPPAHSLISDYFPAERRATALSIYSLGIPLGAGLGFLLGGWIEEFFDWRTAFMVVGLPGVFLALIVRWTLPEPPRGVFDSAAIRAMPSRSVSEVLRFIGQLRSFRHMAFGGALHAFSGYGAAAFIAAFFARSHAIPSGELGTWLALINCTGGVAGTYLGGFLSDRLSVRDVRWAMWVPAIATVMIVPFALLLCLWPDGRMALLFWLPGAVLGGFYLGPTFATTQTLVAPSMRATASAILLFIINIIGLGLGPQGVGIASDLLEPALGNDSLRYALLGTLVLFASWSACHYALGARFLAKDLEAKNQGID
ncbi:MFS transporter [Myxococcota bacterium]|nr:MFS transporter [Myxococcota bacterium]